MGRTVLHDGQLVKLGLESVQLPNGQALQLEVVRHPGGAAVVALNEDNALCLLRQYRHAAGGWLWELPAGKIDAGESPRLTAERELREEAGLLAAQWRELPSTITTPGFCDEIIHLYLARELTTTAQELQDDEAIEVHWKPFDWALRQVCRGEIRDAKSMLGILLTQQVLAES